LKLDCKFGPYGPFDGESNGIVLVRGSFLAVERGIKVGARFACERNLLICSISFQTSGGAIVAGVLAEGIEVIGVIRIIINDQIS
jgi:hypothetical protein